MRLLFDENLSYKLAKRVEDLFPDSRHISSFGLNGSEDLTVWEFAKVNGYSVVSADADFYDMALAMGPPPKVIWLRGCDYPTAVAEQLIRSQAIRVAEFLRSDFQAVLVLSQASTS